MFYEVSLAYLAKETYDDECRKWIVRDPMQELLDKIRGNKNAK